jgi:pyruvate/2-oxoglutarate dehydrogenase complex dihydrolipoamide dehydrogenase (E3) component
MATQYDCIIIGSGQAGTPLAGAFAKAGKKTALIERTHIGGCCVNEGCTPTKTMVASGRVAYLARRGPDYGVHIASDNGQFGTLAKENSVKIDMGKVRDRKRKIVESFRAGNIKRTQDAKVDILMGEGSFVDAKTIKVKMSDGKEVTVTADTICINTCERPAAPTMPGIDKVPSELVLNSTSIMELDKVPKHLLVVGGGYIGVEFGQLFRRSVGDIFKYTLANSIRRLGAEVTIAQRASQLMAREDKEIADCLRDILKEDGINIMLNTSVETVEYDSSTGITLSMSSKDGQKTQVKGSHLLYAAGRVPNVEALNLNAAGINCQPNKKYIACNEKLETNVPGIYVLGDVKGPPAFTHISYDDFRIIKANLITNVQDPSKAPLTTTSRIVPYVAYTDPQLAHVGLHEAEAKKKFPGKTIKTAKIPMTYVARALETDETRGMMKAVVDADSGMILGFTCLGVEGGEVMSIVQMAMMGGVHYQVLADAVWAHPALAESLNTIWGFLE